MLRRKWIVLAVFSALMLTLFAACSGDEKESTDDGDAEGKEEINFYIKASQKPDADKYVDELSKLSGYNLNYEFISPEEYLNKLPILFASGELPDAIQTDGIEDHAHEGALENGIFMELDSLLEEYGSNILEGVPDEVWESPRVSKDGEIYAIPTLAAAPNTRTTYIRKDWLDKLDMDTPETLDDWLEYFEGIKQQDMNGDGDPDDEYGHVLRKSQSFNELFFGAFGVHPSAWHIKDGEMIPDMIIPDVKDAIAFYRDLYSEGHINQDFFTTEAQDWGNAFLQGKAGSFSNSVMGYATYGNPDEFDESGVEVELVAPPTGPDGKSGLDIQTIGLSSVLVIPSDTENPEEIIKYLDWAWSSEEADKFFSFGIKGHNYTEEDGEIQFDENAEVNTENFMRSLYAVFLNPWGDSQLSPSVLEVIKNGDVIEEALQVSEEQAVSTEDQGMPYLEAYAGAPELFPGLGDGTLFLEMFAKVVSGREDLDPAFDKFVETWKKRGGDEAIQEATKWYNNKKE